MGSHTFYDRSKMADPIEAYRYLVVEARSEYGTDPYSGTIATTTGVHVVSRVPMPAAAADRLVARRIEDLSKWDQCEAIAVGTPGKSRTAKVKITVEPDDEGKAELTDDTIAASLGVSSDAIAKVTVTQVDPRQRIETRPAGPARRVWTVTGLPGEYPTKTAATAAARAAIAAEAAPRRPETFRQLGSCVWAPRVREVVQRIIREPEAALVPRLIKVTYRAEVEIATGPVEFDHWLFYGWAAT